MLRINGKDSADAVKAYLIGSSRGDYYTKDSEIIGNWGGKGAAMLGLSGALDTTAFANLVDNVNPATLGPLTPRTKANRKVGYDFTFDVPKSVSVLYGLTDDPRIMAAVRKAVYETMADIEEAIQTRVRINGEQDANRVTGNLVWGEFIHLTGRPVDGVPDPQLHWHIFAINATFDETEKKWKAANFRQIVEDAPTYQAAFHSRVSAALQDMGLSITRRGIAFEIDGIPESVNKKFSRRKDVIEEEAERRGTTDPKEKAKLGALTREPKNKTLNPLELKKHWERSITPEELAQVMNVWQRIKTLPKTREHEAKEPIRARDHLGTRFSLVTAGGLTPAQRQAEKAAVEQAILHCFWTKSAVSEMKFKEAILRFGIGTIRVHQLQRVIAGVPNLLRKEMYGRIMVTTKQVLEEEKRMVAWVREGRDAVEPLAPGHKIQDRRLGDDQRAAVTHILQSSDRVTGMEGRAGTGKTTLMKEAIEAIRSGGHKVVVLAPTAAVAKDLLRKEGFKDADTVDGWLTNTTLQRQVGRGAVWWIDEAGLLSTRAMVRLSEVASQQDARIILGGDTRQHRSVERGDALRILKEYAELPLAVVETVRRQSGIYREATEAFSRGELLLGFQKLDAMNSIVELPDADRYKALAREYVDAVKKGEPVMAVSPTHSEIRKVTTAIREELKSRGQLKNDKAVETLRQVKMSPAEKRDLRSFRQGLVLEMTKSAPGNLMPGDRVTVMEFEPEHLVVKLADGQWKKFDPQKHYDRFEVYQPEDIALSKGDRIQITKNRRSVPVGQRVSNGTFHTVVGFTPEGDIKLNNGVVLPKEFKHLTHGYAATSFVAQGKTVTKVFVAESPESFPAGSREQFYTAISRGVKDPRIFTNDREDLFDAVTPSSQRTAALDLVNKAREPAKPVAAPTMERGDAEELPSPTPLSRILAQAQRVPKRVKKAKEREPELEMDLEP